MTKLEGRDLKIEMGFLFEYSREDLFRKQTGRERCLTIVIERTEMET